MPAPRPLLPDVKALACDVFGTVVDWRGSIIRQGKQLGPRWGLHIDWGRFADAWRAAYRPSMERVRRGDLPWTNLDVLHRMSLGGVLGELGVSPLTEEQTDRLVRTWHRLDPWPDARPGLLRLHEHYVLTTLSNGNVALLVAMGRAARLPWDFIFSAELARAYKPDGAVYGLAAELLALHPEEVLMVAAHADDLVHAHAVGFRTAFVERPLEHGPGGGCDEPPAGVDVVATDLMDLAEQLGC